MKDVLLGRNEDKRRIIMEQRKINEVEFEEKILEDVVNIILDLGYKIYIYDSKLSCFGDSITAFSYTNGKDWAYIQLNRYEGIDGGTQYKPSRENKSGRMVFEGKTNFTKDDFVKLLDACNIDYNIYNCIPYNFERDTLFRESYFELVP